MSRASSDSDKTNIDDMNSTNAELKKVSLEEEILMRYSTVRSTPPQIEEVTGNESELEDSLKESEDLQDLEHQTEMRARSSEEYMEFDEHKKDQFDLLNVEEAESRLEEEIEEYETDSRASEPIDLIDVPPSGTPTTSDDVIEYLKRLKEDVGQISELHFEEENIIDAFSKAFFQFMKPLAKTVPVDTRILPKEFGNAEKANILPDGDLVVLLSDGRMQSINLKEAGNRDLLVIVINDVMPRFNSLVSKRREMIERRITFLAELTRELQTIAESFAMAT